MSTEFSDRVVSRFNIYNAEIEAHYPVSFEECLPLMTIKLDMGPKGLKEMLAVLEMYVKEQECRKNCEALDQMWKEYQTMLHLVSE